MARGESLANESFRDLETAGRSRVVELFIPTLDCNLVDLATDSWNMPEVVTAIHEADEVHVHSLGVSLALTMIPYVFPKVLEKTTLVIHGPCARRGRNVPNDATRLQSWPGPVKFDPWADRELGRWVDGELKRQTDSARDNSPLATNVDVLDASAAAAANQQGGGAEQWIWLDPTQAELLPSACGPAPIVAIDQSGECLAQRVVMIAVSASVAVELRSALVDALTAKWPSIGGESLALEIVDESTLSRPRAQRRVCQLALAADLEDPVIFEAVCQGVPCVLLAELQDRDYALLPPGFLACSASMEGLAREPDEDEAAWCSRRQSALRSLVLDSLVAQIAVFAERWRAGLCACEGLDARRDWVLARAYPN